MLLILSKSETSVNGLFASLNRKKSNRSKIVIYSIETGLKMQVQVFKSFYLDAEF